MSELAYRSLYVESYFDERRSRTRIRPLPGQWAASTHVVECSRSMRDMYPLGTVFRLEVARKTYAGEETHLYAPATADYFVVDRNEAIRSIAAGR